jgi:hypothetical protein
VIALNLGSITIDHLAIAELSSTAAGAGIVADLMRRGTNVQQGARALVGKRTRKLEMSIVKRLDHRDGVPVVIVGTDVSYAVLVHEGTPPHVITPRNRQVLRFPAPGASASSPGVVFAKVVHHPGTTGQRFLVRALPLAAL